ncbi:MAG: hypothetical protein H6707_03960 [Deltaproteobacteria bacterium]|nr:hypothetical protein [Deltaproteobacteria bacterium]
MDDANKTLTHTHLLGVLFMLIAPMVIALSACGGEVLETQSVQQAIAACTNSQLGACVEACKQDGVAAIDVSCEDAGSQTSCGCDVDGDGEPEVLRTILSGAIDEIDLL